MASYSESFKRNAVEFLSKLRNTGKFELNNIEIKNIRELCVFLDVSSQTLYRWEKIFPLQKSKINDVSDDNFEIDTIKNIIECEKSSWCKSFQSDDDEGYGACNMIGECDGFIEVKDAQESESDLMKLHLGESNEVSKDDFFSPEAIKKGTKKTKSTGKKEIFTQRYYGWFAGMLGIKGYSNMLVPQLKLTIGNELIRQSGLIDMNKASAKLKKNGINK